MYQWSLKELELPLQFVWKISRAQSHTKKIIIVKIEDGTHSAFGELAGLTQKEDQSESLLQIFNQLTKTPEDLLDRLLSPSVPAPLRFAMSSALDHLQAQKRQQNLSDFLQVPQRQTLPTSFSLPIMPLEEIEDFFHRFKLRRFSSLKIKIDRPQDINKCRRVYELFQGPLRIDMNEAFESDRQVIDFAEQLSGLPVEFLEQPLPVSQTKDYQELKKHCPLPIFADESLQSQDVDEDLASQFHGINVKLMKAGSYRQALKQLRQARDLGLKTMLGCMVETSLGIAGALSIAHQVDYFDLDGFLYFKDEPFQWVTEQDGLLQHTKPFPAHGSCPRFFI